MSDTQVLANSMVARPRRSSAGPPSPHASVVGRLAWVSENCPPQLPKPCRAQSRVVIAPHHQTALPARIDLQAIDRFSLEPLHTCAARQHSAGRPYVYMHIAARTGPRHARVPQGAPAPWLSLVMTPDAHDARLSPPSLSYTLLAKPSYGHIDNIFFFCLIGADCQVQWLGSLDEAASHRTVRLIITTLLMAERGEPQALLRAGLMFEHGLGVERRALLAQMLTQSALAHGATDLDAAAARASMLFVRDFRWLGAAFPPKLPMAPSLAAHEAVGSLAYAVRQQWLASVVTLVGQGLDADAHWPTTPAHHCNAQPLFAALQGRAPSILRALHRRSTICLGQTPQAQQARQTLFQFAREHASPKVLVALELFRPDVPNDKRSAPTLLWDADLPDTELDRN